VTSTPAAHSPARSIGQATERDGDVSAGSVAAGTAGSSDENLSPDETTAESIQLTTGSCGTVSSSAGISAAQAMAVARTA
jgi:hypothetical protein